MKKLPFRVLSTQALEVMTEVLGKIKVDDSEWTIDGWCNEAHSALGNRLAGLLSELHSLASKMGVDKAYANALIYDYQEYGIRPSFFICDRETIPIVPGEFYEKAELLFDKYQVAKYL